VADREPERRRGDQRRRGVRVEHHAGRERRPLVAARDAGREQQGRRDRSEPAQALSAQALSPHALSAHALSSHAHPAHR
jgi:hypothetical protein